MSHLLYCRGCALSTTTTISRGRLDSNNWYHTGRTRIWWYRRRALSDRHRLGGRLDGEVNCSLASDNPMTSHAPKVGNIRDTAALGG